MTRRAVWSLGIIVCSLSSVLQLSGCFSTAVSGASLLYDKHTVHQRLNDHWLALQCRNVLDQYRMPPDTRLNVSVQDQVVLLLGQTTDPSLKQTINKQIRRIHDIKKVFDYVSVEPPLSNTTIMRDTWISTKIHTQLALVKGIDLSHLTITTENRTVYLMGLVTPEQSDKIVTVAQRTSGVKKVVTMFAYMHINHSKVG